MTLSSKKCALHVVPGLMSSDNPAQAPTDAWSCPQVCLYSCDFYIVYKIQDSC